MLATTTSDPELRTAGFADISGISHIMAEVFRQEPVAQWLVPDPVQRYPVLYDLFGELVTHTLGAGTVHVTTELSAAALWLPRITPHHRPPDLADLPARLRAAAGPYAQRFHLLETTLGGHHPGGPHHHLSWLGVHQVRRSRGVGSALLRYQHRILDAARVPAHLVAGSEAGRDFCQRHGYVSEGRITLPDRGPSLWPMWRHPRAIP